jgi:hypothetical protein
MVETIPINYVKGQKWIEIQGTYSSDQLRKIADQIDKVYESAFKKEE